MVKKRQTVNFKKNFFENAAWKQKSVVVGIDEVGRGCLAGPLVTAAVILPPFRATYRLLKDSKQLDLSERILAYKWINKHCWYGVGIVHNRLIDQHNIWQATLIAMKKALIHLLAISPYKQQPSGILVDAMPLELLDTSYKDIPVHYFPKGEQKSSSIAAASIVAKVTRDHLMQQFDAIFPSYKLGQHKGYSTKIHKNVVKEQGHSIIHRMSFLGKTLSIEDDEHDQQQILC